MKRIIIATAALLALAAPLAASAETFTNGTSATTGTRGISGTVCSQASNTTYSDGVELSIQGSLQSVKSLSIDETTVKYDNLALGAGGTKQVDAALAIDESVYSSVATSHQQFRGVQTSSSATASSSAFTSISPN